MLTVDLCVWFLQPKFYQLDPVSTVYADSASEAAGLIRLLKLRPVESEVMSCAFLAGSKASSQCFDSVQRQRAKMTVFCENSRINPE